MLAFFLSIVGISKHWAFLRIMGHFSANSSSQNLHAYIPAVVALVIKTLTVRPLEQGKEGWLPPEAISHVHVVLFCHVTIPHPHSTLPQYLWSLLSAQVYSELWVLVLWVVWESIRERNLIYMYLSGPIHQAELAPSLLINSRSLIYSWAV